MKKYTLSIASLVFVAGFLSSCNTATPENYFDRAVLNTNMLYGFANTALLRQLEEPSVKATENGGVVPMLRVEVIEDKIAFVENSLSKIKDLKKTEETKEILESSIALHEYVLPVYKNEYHQLAVLYDQQASPEAIRAAADQIHDKYEDGFAKLHEQLTNAGKRYAEKNKINVNWGVNPSPSGQ